MSATSSLISLIHESRLTILRQMKALHFETKDYDNVSVNEVNSMFQNKQLDMLLERDQTIQVKQSLSQSQFSSPEFVPLHRKQKVYIRYYLAKAIRPANVEEIVDDLFRMEPILTKDDILYIVIKDEMNDTLRELLKHIWEQEGIFIVIQNMKRLQFNILEHTLVPPHQVVEDEDKIQQIFKQFNVTHVSQLPEILRFDPVAQVLCLRPGQICEIIRPSKTAVNAFYYRVCV